MISSQNVDVAGIFAFESAFDWSFAHSVSPMRRATSDVLFFISELANASVESAVGSARICPRAYTRSPIGDGTARYPLYVSVFVPYVRVASGTRGPASA